MLNDALTHSAVLIQVNTHTLQFYIELWNDTSLYSCDDSNIWCTLYGYINCIVQTYLQGHGMHGHGETVHIPFPFDEEDLKAGESF